MEQLMPILSFFAFTKTDAAVFIFYIVVVMVQAIVRKFRGWPLIFAA